MCANFESLIKYKNETNTFGKITNMLVNTAAITKILKGSVAQHKRNLFYTNIKPKQSQA